MRTGTHRGALWLLLACLPVVVTAQDAGHDELELLVTIPTPPTPVRADGRTLLAYELHLYNAGSEPVTVTRLLVSDPSPKAKSQTVALLQGEELGRMFKPTLEQAGDPRRLARGAHAVVMLFLSLDAAPLSLAHQLTGEMLNRTVVASVPARPVTGTAVRIGAPLRGDRWLTANGPANDTHHRRSWLAAGGGARTPQRFAIDFTRQTAGGDLVDGDRTRNESYPGYGADVLAVAAGVVVSVADGVPDNLPPTTPEGVTIDTMGGNSVVLDIGGGRFAWYAHLQAGSIRVKPKQRVAAGAVLGKVGNSGNSNAPHLHFHVTDGPHPMLSDGVPYVFEAFTYNGRRYTAELPLRDWVVAFP